LGEHVRGDAPHGSFANRRGPPFCAEAAPDWLLELRRKENDLTLDAIAGRLLRAHGVAADKSMLSRFFAAEGISFKKNRARQRTASSRRR
jgi:transposase